MRAMIFEQVGEPLRAVELEKPSPGPGELLLRVHACGVCRTDLHLLDGEVEVKDPPRVLGHQIIGTTESGDRVGHEFLTLAPEVPVKTRVSSYALEDANEALADLRAGRFTGAAVIVP